VGFTLGRFAFCGGKHYSRFKELKVLQDSLLTDFNLKDRTKIVMALAELRMEWQDAVKGSLLKVDTPVGLILSDIADRLQLTEQERYAFLGGRLMNEVAAERETKVRLNKPL